MKTDIHMYHAILLQENGMKRSFHLYPKKTGKNVMYYFNLFLILHHMLMLKVRQLQLGFMVFILIWIILQVVMVPILILVPEIDFSRILKNQTELLNQCI